MEPSTEPPTTPAPPGPVRGDLTLPAATAPPQRKRRGRQVLLVMAAVLALLCLGGAATAFLYYDRATTPDLGTPALVTREYLSAYLVDRDDAKAAPFRCGDASGLASVKGFRDDIDSRQKTYNVTITVSVESVIEASRSGTSAQVGADIVLLTTSDGSSLRRVQHWQFTTRDDGGWRVCEGHEVT